MSASATWSLLDLTKIKARYFFGAWIFGALVIFLPEAIKQKMAITIPETVRPWLGFSTLAAFVLWVVLVSLYCASKIKDWFDFRRRKSEALSQLETLSQGERDIFILCLSLNQRTIQRNITDPAANSLLAKRLLVIAPQGNILAMPFTIPKFAWEYLKSNETELFPELHDERAMAAFHERQRNGWMAR